MSGLALGTAFGVQSGMNRLAALPSPLGEELRKLEEARRRLRRKGATNPSQFSGDAAEAEAHRLHSTRRALLWP